MPVKTEKRIRRCTKCANSCPLDNPKCKTGEDLRDTLGLYEEVEVKISVFEKLFGKKS